MKNISKIKIIFIIMSFFVVTSCYHVEKYSYIPHIDFIEYQLLLDPDSIPIKGVIVFSFTDGDGDIGLYDNEINPPYDNNLFVKYFELHNGNWVPYINATGDTVNFNSRIPILTPNGKNKNISGIIYDTVTLNKYSDNDTVKYIIHIQDRALNKSNIIETPPIKTSL